MPVNPSALAYPLDLRAVCSVQRVMARSWWRPFAVVSRLGNGVFWYTLMGLLPIVDGLAGLMVSGTMAVVGGLGTLVYLHIKRFVRRPRPCEALPSLFTPVAPLDRWSFPSGHTLHAVSFTVICTAAYPWAGVLLWPFTVLVAGSRLVLGLHYPSDVLCGAAIGASLALAIPCLWSAA